MLIVYYIPLFSFTVQRLLVAALRSLTSSGMPTGGPEGMCDVLLTDQRPGLDVISVPTSRAGHNPTGVVSACDLPGDCHVDDEGDTGVLSAESDRVLSLSLDVSFCAFSDLFSNSSS